MSTTQKKQRGRFQDFVGDRAITLHKVGEGEYDIIAHRDPTHIKRVSNAGAAMRDLWLQHGNGMSFKDYLKSIKDRNPLKGQQVGSRGYTTEEYYAKDAHRHPKVRQLSQNPKIAKLTPTPQPKLKPRKSTAGMIAKGHITQILLEGNNKPERYSDKGKPIFNKKDRAVARKHILDNYDYYYPKQQ